MTKKFRFLHFADAHIGYSGNASRHNEFRNLRIEKEIDGVNVRTLDINKTYEQVIDLAIEHDVDAVLDGGDLFDQWGYKANNIFNFVQRQLKRLEEKKIPYVGVIGNHDLPKLRNKGTYLEGLSILQNTHFAYQGFYEQFELPEHDVVFHLVPSTFRQDILDASLDEVSPVDGKINIGLGHFGVTEIGHYAEAAINSLVVTLDRLIACEMDYFGLGDYHIPTAFETYNIYYPGSIDRQGFGELGMEPQVLLVEIDAETKETTVQPIRLDVRPMFEVPSLDVKEIKVAEEDQSQYVHAVNTAIADRLRSVNLEGAIARFRVRNLPKELKPLIDSEEIKALTDHALHFKIEFLDKLDKTREAKTGGLTFTGVLQGWGAFVDSIENDGSYDKEKLKELGYNKLLEVYDNDATV